MKKTAYILALCMIAAVFTACGSGKASVPSDIPSSSSSFAPISEATADDTSDASAIYEQSSVSEESANETSETSGIITEISQNDNTDIIGYDADAFAELYFSSKEEFIKWLGGNSDKLMKNIEGEVVRVHEDSKAENARKLLDGRKLYCLTMNGTALKPVNEINVSYYRESSVMIEYTFSDDSGKTIYCSFRYYDKSYDEALKKGTVRFFEEAEKIENMDIIDFEKYSVINYSIYDYGKSEYIDTEVLLNKQDNRIRYFVFDNCRIELSDLDRLYQPDDFQHLGFTDMPQE